MLTIKVKFRPSSVADKEGTLYYQVIHLRKVATVSTTYHIYPHEWDEAHETIRLRGNREETRDRKAVLLLYQTKIDWEMSRMQQIVTEKEEEKGDCTITELLDDFRNNPAGMSVFCNIRTQISRKTQMACYGTARCYENCLRSFRKFRNGKDLELRELDCDLVEEYEAWMLHTGLKRNSASCYLRTFRTLYRLAVEDGVTVNRDIFRKVRISIRKTSKRAISTEAIRAIRQLDLSAKPSLAFARDLFMFSFFTRGMSFIDIAHLKKSNLRNGFLTYNRRKTFQSLTIQWERPMQIIVEQYARQTYDSPYLFPIVKGETPTDRKQYEQALQRINRNLKRIGQMAGVSIPLSTYVARHSWASIARNMNVPLSIISEGLGHDSDRTTQIYLASLDTSIVNKANKKIINSITRQLVPTHSQQETG